MEQIHTQVLLNGQLAAFFMSQQKVKRRLIDHLIKLVCVFVPYKPHIYISLHVQ